MPPEITIQPDFATAARAIRERKTYEGHALVTDTTDFDLNEERIEDKILEKIQAVRKNIRNRIAADERVSPIAWNGNDGHKWHIVKRDLHPIMAELEAICPGCNTVNAKCGYSVAATENGTVYLDITEGTVDHETDETNTDGDYTYQCFECGEDLKTNSLEYVIPENAYNELCNFLREILTNERAAIAEPEVITENMPDQVRRWIPQWQRDAVNAIRDGQQRQQNQNGETFPIGNQVQKDIPGHGPNGPQMNTSPKGIQTSGPEAFIFRDTGRGWLCKHCDNRNNGENKKCGNRNCQKDKFAPVKDIKLTT